MKDSQPQGRTDMRFEASMTLKEQIESLASELERTQSELRILQRQHRQVNLAKRMTYLAGFA
jgi:dynactin complex subunit